MSIAPDYSRVSIREHTVSRNTDQLYDPLRDTFTNPQNVQRHSALTPIATRSSFVSRDYKILTPEELQRLEQNIYIPNAPLYATNNLAPIRNEKFVAVDASERIIGAPITPEELERIRSQGFKKEEVLYELRKDQPVNSTAVINSRTINVNNNSVNVNSRSINVNNSSSINAVNSPKSQKLNAAPPSLEPIQEQVVYEYEPIADRYTVQNFDDYGKHEADYKYNLFSIVDEPFNKCREFGLQGCTSCPGNEVIASRNRPLSLTWH